MSEQTTAASYLTSAYLFFKGLLISATDTLAGLSPEGKIGAALGLGTFLVNWYFRWREDRRREREAMAEAEPLAARDEPRRKGPLPHHRRAKAQED